MVFVMNMSNIEIHEGNKEKKYFLSCNPISQKYPLMSSYSDLVYILQALLYLLIIHVYIHMYEISSILYCIQRLSIHLILY